MNTELPLHEGKGTVLARVFWSLGSQEQARFFSELANIVKSQEDENPAAWGNGALQWLFIAEHIKDNKDAVAVILAAAEPYKQTERGANDTR